MVLCWAPLACLRNLAQRLGLWRPVIGARSQSVTLSPDSSEIQSVTDESPVVYDAGADIMCSIFVPSSSEHPQHSLRGMLTGVVLRHRSGALTEQRLGDIVWFDVVSWGHRLSSERVSDTVLARFTGHVLLHIVLDGAMNDRVYQGSARRFSEGVKSRLDFTGVSWSSNSSTQ